MAGKSGPGMQAQIYRPMVALAGFHRGRIDCGMARERIRRPGVYRVLGVAVVLAACAGDQGGVDGDVLIVAVPVHPIAGIVDALAPEGILEVVVLVPPGANPETHEPSIETLRRLAIARLYLEIGHPAFTFERTWLNGALDGSAAVRVPLFEGCPLRDGDPHAWLSTRCLAAAAAVTANALAGVLPEHSEEIAANLDRFNARLEKTADVTERRLAPYNGRMFFVLHPAFGYLATDNDLQQIEILSHGSGDPGASRIAELIRL
ncbi:MAG: hypothetical protein E4H28_08610, partial [Gemmatimonadales bacterium]